MEQIEIYPGRDRWRERSLETWEEKVPRKEDRELIRAFQNQLYAKGRTGDNRIVKLTVQLARIAKDLGLPFGRVTKRDAEALMAKYTRSKEWTEATKADYRRAFKQFYLWLEEEDPRLDAGDQAAREFYRWLKKAGNVVTSYKDPQIDYGEVITEEDLDLLLRKGAANAKERAFLAVLHEGGLRIGEMLNLRLADLEHSENSILLSVQGKTGRRRVPICWALGTLTRWLDDHPRKDEPAAPLWTGDNSCRWHQPLLYPGAYKMVRRCFDRAGLKKPARLHWFRHSRASVYTAAGMNEATLKLYGGWTPGSRQLKRYVHINSKNVQDAVLRLNGLQPSEDARKLPVRCQSCLLPNEPGARYCGRCGRPLSVAVMLQDEKQKGAAIEEAMKTYAEIMADPARAAEFAKFLETFKQRGDP